MGSQEGLPRRPLAARGRGLKAVFREDAIDGVTAELVADVGEAPPIRV
jgi:hypothetical protein